jgi:hypothetical protein
MAVAGALLPLAHANRDPRDGFLNLRHRRRKRLAAVLAVGAAELGAGVRVRVLVPTDVAEVAPAERRRLLPAVPLLVGLHGRAPLRRANGWQGSRGGDDGTAIGFDKGYRCSVLKGGVWVWWFWEVRVAGGVGAGRAWL